MGVFQQLGMTDMRGLAAGSLSQGDPYAKGGL